jgi:hypothetical protein
MNKLKKSDISILREKFIRDFCKERGWNYNELTTGQMLLITKEQSYKNPK